MKLKKRLSTLEILSNSRLYKDYRDAFTEATGLPLTMESPDGNRPHFGESPKSAPFCDWMTKSGATCASCHALQQKLVETARHEPITRKCFAGLYQTAVPVRVGHELVAILRTGHVMVDRPDPIRFNQVAKELLRLESYIDLKQAENAWYASRVLTRSQYESMVRLLGMFAQHLGLCGNQLVLRQNATEPPSIRKAREIIGLSYQDELSLGMIAGKVNVSAGYFSELFKKATGLNFVEYVARVRVAKAKILLQEPEIRVSEVAFEVGFQSLSQFNRAFKKYSGSTPSELRNAAATP